MKRTVASLFIIFFLPIVVKAQNKKDWLEPFKLAVRDNPQIVQSEKYSKNFSQVNQYYYLLPSLHLNGKKSSEKSNLHSKNEDSYFLSSEWNIYRGGGDFNTSSLQNVELEILKNEVETFKLTTALNLADYIAQLAREKALLQTTIEKIKIGQELLSIAKRQTKSGVSLEISSNQLRLKLNDEAIKKIEIENSIVNLENQIRFLTSKDVPNISLPKLSDLVELITEIELNPKNAATKSSELNLQKAQFEKGVAQSQLMPQIDLAAEVGQLEDTPESTQSTRIEARFTWTIYDSSIRSIELRHTRLNEQIANLKAQTVQQNTAIYNRQLGLKIGTIQRRIKIAEEMSDTLSKNADLAVKLANRGALPPIEAWEALEAESNNKLEKHSINLEITQTIKRLLLGPEVAGDKS